MPTFREAAIRTFELNRPRLRSQKTAANWTAQMELHAFSVLATLPVNEIGREAVLRVLTPIWTAHPDIARKLRGRIRAVLAWAQAHGHIEHNVAGEAIDAALPVMPTVTAHYRALPYGQRTDQCAARGRGDGARACRRVLGRAELCTVGPVREAPRPDGSVGGACDTYNVAKTGVDSGGLTETGGDDRTAGT